MLAVYMFVMSCMAAYHFLYDDLPKQEPLRVVILKMVPQKVDRLLCTYTVKAVSGIQGTPEVKGRGSTKVA